MPARLFFPRARRGRAALLVVTVTGSLADGAAEEALAGATVLGDRSGVLKARLAPLRGDGRVARDLLEVLLQAGDATPAVSQCAA